ncbi:MAG: ribonuclease [Firmicutes bacterium]|nr:ribonuclease [Bacillota bacterium]
MILYTIVPPEVVMAEDEDGEIALEEEVLLPGGARLLFRPDGKGRGIVSRLISTDPRDFLDPRFTPGAGIRV